MKFVGEEDFKHQNRQKTGVLICNLGTPETYKTKDVRKRKDHIKKKEKVFNTTAFGFQNFIISPTGN